MGNVQHVFLIGCKGIPAQYGGYETFVENLTRNRTTLEIQYHVACAVNSLAESPADFEHNAAHCFSIPWRKLGPARAIFYDLDAIHWCLQYIKKNQIEHPIFYILACRIGPFMAHCKKQMKRLGGTLLVNPDGHEWLRAKWSAPVRRYWKLSEKLMVKQADILVCDSKNIETYIQQEYAAFRPNTTFIAYGADTEKSALPEDALKLQEWYQKNGTQAHQYYLVVGRFVPENNYETMIREFMRSHTEKKFLLITNVSDKFLGRLKEKTHFDTDPRICFAGTVYDAELLKKIRENAYGYFHGHEVGGTNPSLLEALACTQLNLLLDVGFNREVAEDGALYWNKESGNLAALIDRADALPAAEAAALGEKAHKRIQDWYSWPYITVRYEKLFVEVAYADGR